jgi:predicted ATPase/class 3 adenylate cyclase
MSRQPAEPDESAESAEPDESAEPAAPAARPGRPELPRGTVTLVMTDIEGSTRLLHERGPEYAKLLEAHRRTVRDAFGRHGGVEVDTQGDAFFFAFPSAQEAAAAALEAQRALADGDVRVRIGIHTGEPDVTVEGYVGMDVHRVARIMATGHGGQVVVSQATRALLDAAVRLRDLGEHRLKDLTAPQRLWQLGDGEFPRLRTLHQSNLPVVADPLIGRERELAAIGELFRSHRLLTLAGPGGSGKTRLALQAAADAVDDYPDGVWWVPISAVRDPALVLPAVARTLGMSGTGALDTQIGSKQLLLVLDNLEQVIDVAPALADLLAGTTGVRILATSREPLRIAAERAFAVEPMNLQDAARLFEERATNAEPRAAVLEICRRLDGLPLAIELAAARTSLLPPTELLARLDDRLALLTGGRRDAPDRQRTLRATLEWSHDLLSADEQRAFRGLGAFNGGFTLAAAEAVTQADLETVAALVDKSLVRRLDGGRFTLLQTIGAFARERLADDPQADAIREAHARYFIGLMAPEATNLSSATRRQRVDSIEPELANIAEAIGWALDRGRFDLALRLAGATADAWVRLARVVEGRRWLAAALDAADPSDPDLDVPRMQALFGESVLAVQQADWPAARARGRERLAIAERLGEERHIAQSLLALGRASLGLGDPIAAARDLERVRDWASGVGDPFLLAMSTFNLAYVALDGGDYERARSRFAEALDAFTASGDPLGTARAHAAFGAIGVHAGRFDDAVEHLGRSLAICRQIDARETAAWPVELLGCARAEADPIPAARFLGAAETMRRGLGLGLEGAELVAHDAAVQRLRGSLPQATLDAAWADGAALSFEDALDAAIANAGQTPVDPALRAR